MSNPSRSRVVGLSAGIISKIRVENFMCHSHMEINLGDHINFITGQNGSGKSAILAALCIAFGCRAKSTDRATTLKEFIKTGCSYALVHVEIKNRGEDAFKHDVFGDVIIVERRITKYSSTSVLKDQQGKKVATRREDIRELVEHFNIDVENPCVVMSQDKSREFLHSGNDKDTFKFFFKATLLSQVEDLLKSVRDSLDMANGEVFELERSIAPVEKELDELRGKIKSMEHLEEISQQIQLLRKKCAWSLVYDIDKKIQIKTVILKKREDRIPQCQAKIDQQIAKVAELQDSLNQKKARSAVLMESTSKAKKKGRVNWNKKFLREKIELHHEYDRRSNNIAKMERQIKSHQQQIIDANEQQIKDAQAEEFELENKLKELQDEKRDVESEFQRLVNIEEDLSERLEAARDELRNIISELNNHENRANESQKRFQTLLRIQTNKVTAFGECVPSLLQVIERNHRRFGKPPIGPIGSHLALTHGDKWAVAVEHAIGHLFNSFIVTDHKDFQLLRSCAREANYHKLKIIIFDFSIPRFQIESHRLPHTNHPTTLSAIHSDNPTVLNVLVDQGHAERQVLVTDYEMGKAVAFDQRIQNVKEVYTLEGERMFSCGSAQTTLPPTRNLKVRLCSSYDDQIKNYERERLQFEEQAREIRGKKRSFEEQVQGLNDELQKAKRQCVVIEKQVMSKNFRLKDLKNSRAAKTTASSEYNVDELQHEITKFGSDLNESEILSEKILEKYKEADAKLDEYKAMFAELCELAKGDFNALEKATRELTQIEEDLSSADAEKRHYERQMQEKVHMDIESAKESLHRSETKRKVDYDKASVICPESEIEALGGCGDATSDQLQAHFTRLKLRYEQESQRHQESIDELRMIYEKKERKILIQKETTKSFREIHSVMNTALEKRWSKFERNATLSKRQLTWKFNSHLRKKGISGKIKVNYEDQKLSIEMPQDASSSNARDTRGLSGGERSFSTLCFALAFHSMTEAPFRAMDEFDVFMDAVSRKISLDTIVDFALSQGSQWIFITPHDINMVKHDERIKKQQMAAPRS